MSPRRSKSFRTRTVDDDLQDCNLTRKDLAKGAYSFRRVWAHFRRNEGWTARSGGPLSYDHYYIKPGKNPDVDVEGVDFFYGEAALVQYALANRVLGELPVRAEDGTDGPDGDQRGHSSVSEDTEDDDNDDDDEEDDDNDDDDDDDDDGDGDDGTTPTSPGNQLRGAASVENGHAVKDKRKRPRLSVEQTTKASASDRTGLKASDGEGKHRIRRPVLAAARRTWPADHPAKGRHAGDAISLESDEECEDDARNKRHRDNVGNGPPRPPKPSVSSTTTTKMTVKVEKGDASRESTPCHSSAVDESDDYNGESADSSSQSRPLLRTKKKVKRVQVPTSRSYTPTKKGTHGKKVKSAPRGLMCAKNSSFATHGQQTLNETPPRPARRPIVSPEASTSRINPAPLASASATPIRQPPPATPAKSGITPLTPPRQRRADALIASTSTTQTDSSTTTTHLELSGVSFPFMPQTKFNMKVTVETGTNHETTIWMEDTASRMQRYVFVFLLTTKLGEKFDHDESARGSCRECRFSDIHAFIDPNSQNKNRMTPDVIFNALLRTLSGVAKETISIMKTETSETGDSTNLPGDIDLARNDGDGSISLVFTFPKWDFWSETQTFPMKPVSAEHQLQCTLKQLEDTKQELEAARNDLEAFQRQHQQLEREYQKLRKATQDGARGGWTSSHSSPVRNSPAPQVNPSVLPNEQPRAATRTFFARSSWLATAFPKSPVTVWQFPWDTVVDSSPHHFQILLSEDQGPAVKIMHRGSYMLHINVTHECSIRLVAVITTCNVQRTLEATLVQYYDNKKRTSRIDKMIELNINDSIAVQLRPYNDPSISAFVPAPGMWLTEFSAPTNAWMMSFLDKHMLVSEVAGGASNTNGNAH